MAGATSAEGRVGPKLTRGDTSRTDALATLGAEGCSRPRVWSNGPGDAYGVHDHAQDKVLFCIDGSIVFTTDAGDLELTAGDRLDLPAGCAHGARVGSAGCSCVEAWGR
jgi:mannose-6-phosphate isomerase-like protein (cupin superfamily)